MSEVIQWGCSAWFSETMLNQSAKVKDDESKNRCDKQVSLAHLDLEKSLVLRQKPQVYMGYDSIVQKCTI